MIARARRRAAVKRVAVLATTLVVAVALLVPSPGRTEPRGTTGRTTWSDLLREKRRQGYLVGDPGRFDRRRRTLQLRAGDQPPARHLREERDPHRFGPLLRPDGERNRLHLGPPGDL